MSETHAMPLSEQVAQSCRVLHGLGLMDLRGSLSGRAEEDAFVFGPADGRGADVAAAGQTATLPMAAEPPDLPSGLADEAALHAAIYRRRRDVGGIAITAQPWAMVFGLVDVPLLTVTHQEADLAWRPTPRWGHGRFPHSTAQREEFLDRLGDQNVCHLPGLGVVVVGPSPRAAAVRSHYLELLARNTYMARSLARVVPGGEERIAFIPEEETRRAIAERPDWDHFWRYYGKLDPGEIPAGWVGGGADKRHLPGAGSLGQHELKEQLALACRILYRYGLCAYLEHCSIRIPGQEAFWINPLGDLSSMTAADLATVDFDSNWTAGPHRPPGHKWLHAEIFKQRPDVLAIVHTHQPLARIFAILGEPIPPVQAAGAEWVAKPQPIWPSPALIFDTARAEAVLSVMGRERVVHGRGHGIEYVSDSIAASTFAALASERQAQLAYHAAQLAGSMERVARVELPTTERSPAAWWQYFVRQVQGPQPAWASPYPFHW